MPGLLDFVAPWFTGDALDPLAAQLGLDHRETERGVDLALPLALAAIKRAADHPDRGPQLALAITGRELALAPATLDARAVGIDPVSASVALRLVLDRTAGPQPTGPVAEMVRSTGCSARQAQGILGSVAAAALGSLARLGGGVTTADTVSLFVGAALDQLQHESSPSRLLRVLAAGSAAGAVAGPPRLATDAPPTPGRPASVADRSHLDPLPSSRPTGEPRLLGAPRSAPPPGRVSATTTVGGRSQRWLLVPAFAAVALGLVALSRGGDDPTTAFGTATSANPSATAAPSTVPTTTTSGPTVTVVVTVAPATAPTTPDAAGSTVAPVTTDVAGAVRADPALGRFAEALDAAGLAGVVAGGGPFTVFAPTDAAFAALPAGTFDALLRPEHRTELAHLLGYHLLEDRIEGAELVSSNIVTTEGSRVDLTVDGSAISLSSDAAVTAQVDPVAVPAANGIVYHIDRVLVPAGLVLPTAADGPSEPGTAPPPDIDAADLTVLFDTESWAYRSDQQPKIDAVVAYLRRAPAGTTVRVTGYTDERGSVDGNHALSQARAAVVVGVLRATLGDAAAGIEFSAVADGVGDPEADPESSRRATIEFGR